MPTLRRSRRIVEPTARPNLKTPERTLDTSRTDSNIAQALLVPSVATDQEDESQVSSEESENLIGEGEVCEIHTYQIRNDTRGEQVCLQVGSKTGLHWDKDPSYEAALVVHRWFSPLKVLEKTELLIQSPYIKKALRSVISSYPGVDLNSAGRIHIWGAPRCIFHYRDELQSYTAATDDELVRRHVELCLQHMAKTLRQEIAAYRNMMESDSMSPGLEFSHLWMAFMPGDLLYQKLDPWDFVGRLIEMNLVKAQDISPNRGIPERWAVRYEFLVDNGKTVGYVGCVRFIDHYEGYKPLVDLSIYPLRYHPMCEHIKEALILRGRKYLSLCGIQHKLYNGHMLSSEDRQCDLYSSVTSHKIVLDIEQYSNIFPTAPPNGYISSPGKKPLKYESSELLDLNEIELLLCDCVRYGFSLTTKEWGSFAMSGVQDIMFRMTAFDNLVLSRDKKDLISSLIKVPGGPKRQFDDMVDGKGKGLIVLLHGPPGVGKTFTVESISEYTQRPVYHLQCGDFGTALEVEKSLTTALFLATRWNAIVLLDEADVFMEERSRIESERNKLISVLLRTLEYFEGTLFLTTNRVGSIDPAFKSRIHLSITYPPFSAESRATLWRTFILKDCPATTVPWLDEKFLQRIAELDINGRQIRNIIQMARTRAFNEERDMEPGDILIGLEALRDFENDFSKAVELTRRESRQDYAPRPKKRKEC